MRIREYTVADLKQCLVPGQWFQGNPIPISKQRALSQVNNPRAEATDVVLLVAYDGDTVVCHLGILPDRIFRNSQEQRIGWLTAWWANPDRKYAGLGLLLLSRAFSLYQGRLGASGFSEDARKVYEATKKFAEIQDLAGFNGIARLNLHRLLRKRQPALAKAKKLLKVMDTAINACVGIRQSRWRKSHPLPDSFRIEYLPEMDQEADEFIQQHSTHGLTRRAARELNWIEKYPWLICEPLAQPSGFRFSSAAENYSVFNAKLYYPGDHLVAVLMLTEIDDHVIVPYCFHNHQAALVARLLGHFLIAQQSERFTVFQPDLIEELSRLRFPWIKTIRRRRTWIWSKEFAREETNGLMVQDGDGDCAFTV